MHDALNLEDYRLEVVEKLKACQDPDRARGLLSEVDLALMNAQVSARAQKRFWEALNSDLDVLARGSAVRLDRGAVTTLDRIIFAAQAAIVLYHLSIASDELDLGS
jgi:hypothetical protein